jgi:hypothetical protein
MAPLRFERISLVSLQSRFGTRIKPLQKTLLLSALVLIGVFALVALFPLGVINTLTFSKAITVENELAYA